MARRPPNSGTVMASSTRREGSAASSSPSSRTSEKGSLGSSTAEAISASARSRTRPASGPYSRMIGRPGRAGRGSCRFLFREARPSGLIDQSSLDSGRAMRDAEWATSGAGGEIGRKPRLDVFGDLLRGAILGVAEGAGCGRSAACSRGCRRTPARRSSRSSPTCWWRGRPDCTARRCRNSRIEGSAVLGSTISEERLVENRSTSLWVGGMPVAWP